MELIFDSHAHYDDHAFDKDREELLAGLSSNGVGYVMNVSARLDEMKASADLAEKYDFIYASAGVHPTEVYELADGDISEIEKALSHPKVKAVGEIGLDYHFNDTDKAKQKKWFEMQADLALKHKMPVIIHSRDAASDTLEMVKAMGLRDAGGVMHCFSYEPEMAKIYLDMGFYIGVGGVVTFKNARKLKETVAYMPMDRMLLETDCPYMAPTPHRGERNDSTLIKYVADEIAGIKNMKAEAVIAITTENAMRMYGI